jgi:hypothetical protein
MQAKKAAAIREAWGEKPCEHPGLDGAVESVEERLLDVNGGPPQTALTFHYANQAQLARWKSLIDEGTLLALAPPA